MKTRSLLTVASLIAASLAIVAPVPANASQCSAEDPCGVWSMLDANGTITNNIVCQASLRVMVTLTGEGRRTLWSATYKDGAPMNGTNDAAVMRVFFADVISRLESHRFIRKRAAP